MICNGHTATQMQHFVFGTLKCNVFSISWDIYFVDLKNDRVQDLWKEKCMSTRHSGHGIKLTHLCMQMIRITLIQNSQASHLLQILLNCQICRTDYQWVTEYMFCKWLKMILFFVYISYGKVSMVITLLNRDCIWTHLSLSQIIDQQLCSLVYKHDMCTQWN